MRPETDLRPYQNRVIDHLYGYNAVQAILPMGSGKTVSALTAIKELKADGFIRAALVLAPKRVAQLVWPKEVGQWEHLSDMKVQLVSGSPAERLKKLLTPGADVYVIGIDNTQWLVEELEKLPADHWLFDLLCIDELSRFKNPRGKRGKALMRVVRNWDILWGLTGTPRPNGYEDQFRPLTLLTKARLWGKSFDKWHTERFMPLDYHGRKHTLRWEWRDRTIADIQSVSIRIADEDMPELPELTPVFHWIDLPPAVRKVYKDMERKCFAQYGKNPAILAANQAVATGKLAQIIQGFMYPDKEVGGDIQHLHSEKADTLVDILEDLNGDPALVAYDFIEDLRVLHELYPGTPHLGRGTTDKKAELYEAQWNRRELERLFLHPASAGHGLNLQHGGRQMVWFGLTWSGEQHDQTLKRFHRSGQDEHCFVHYILARDTIDQVKYDRVIGKMTSQDAFVKYMKEV